MAKKKKSELKTEPMDTGKKFLKAEHLWQFKHAVMQRKFLESQIELKKEKVKVSEKEVDVARLILELEKTKVTSAQQALGQFESQYQELRKNLIKENNIAPEMVENFGINEISGEIVDLKGL